MLSLNDIHGQATPVKFFTRVLKSGRRANAYLLSGPLGVGKATLAKAFLTAILCDKNRHAADASACGECPACKKMLSGNHPDILWIAPEKNKSIKIEEIRKAKEMLNLKPYEAGLNACVIENAHMMTPEAANALLKTLEEPPGESLFILISDKKELLLPTVVSRCVEIKFGYLPIETAKEVIKEKTGLGEKEALFLAYISNGSPGAALEMSAGDIVERERTLSLMLGKVARAKDPGLVGWDKEKRDEIEKDIELILMLARDSVMEKEKAGRVMLGKDGFSGEARSFFEGLTTDEMNSMVGKLVRLERFLKSNVNPKIVAQVLAGALKG